LAAADAPCRMSVTGIAISEVVVIAFSGDGFRPAGE
jgi:hypothetical protein